MNTLKELQERLSAYAPTVIKDNGANFTACRLAAAGEKPRAEFYTMIVTREESTALALSGEATNCVAVIGGQDRTRFLKCACSVVFFPADVQLSALMDDIALLLTDAAHYTQARQRLTDEILKRADIQRLTLVAEELLDAPVAVFDVASAPLAMGKRFQSLQNDAALQEYQSRGYISYRFAEGNMYRSFIRTLENATQPFTFRYPDGSMLPRRTHKIYLENRHVAHCSMILERELTDTDDEILALFCQLVGLELERSSYNPYLHTPDSILLRHLLDGAYKSEQEFTARAELYHWKLSRNLYVLNLPRRRSSVARAQIRLIPAILIQEVYSKLLPHVRSMHPLVLPERTLILLDAERSGILERSFQELDESFRADGIICAISNRFGNILEFESQVEQTELLLHALAYSDAQAGLLHGGNQFLPRILYSLQDRGLRQFCPQPLLDLWEQGGRELLHTAYVYLEVGSSVKEAAAQLFIHRNTLLRRLTKFQEQTGLTLTRGEDVLKVLLTYQFLTNS